LSAVRETFDQFQSVACQAFGVNEGSAESHQQFKDKLSLPFELLVDEGLEVASAYGALKEDGNRINRTVVIVGKNGNVIYRAAGAPPPGELIAAIREAADE
jgi:peroxiredoxin Q/BCP